MVPLFFKKIKKSSLFLMYLKADCIGRNLTAATNAFFCGNFQISWYLLSPKKESPPITSKLAISIMQDPWWNPAVEEQAIM